MANEKKKSTGEHEPGEGGENRFTWGEGDIEVTEQGTGEKLDFGDDDETKDKGEGK